MRLPLTPPPPTLPLQLQPSSLVDTLSHVVGGPIPQESKIDRVHDWLINSLLEQEQPQPSSEGEFTELEGLISSPFKPSSWQRLHRQVWEKYQAEKSMSMREQDERERRERLEMQTRKQMEEKRQTEVRHAGARQALLDQLAMSKEAGQD
jgi:hypothetical protein